MTTARRFFFLPFLLSAVFLLLTACTTPTAPAVPTERAQLIAAAVEDVLAIGLVPVLVKNPAYAAEARLAATLINSATAATLTPAGLEATVARLRLAPEDARALSGLLAAAWDTYQRRYAAQVGASLRPDVRLFLGAVSAGIDRAIAATPK